MLKPQGSHISNNIKPLPHLVQTNPHPIATLGFDDCTYRTSYISSSKFLLFESSYVSGF